MGYSDMESTVISRNNKFTCFSFVQLLFQLDWGWVFCRVNIVTVGSYTPVVDAQHDCPEQDLAQIIVTNDKATILAAWVNKAYWLLMFGGRFSPGVNPRVIPTTNPTVRLYQLDSAVAFSHNCIH